MTSYIDLSAFIVGVDMLSIAVHVGERGGEREEMSLGLA
jgi:hypothetical protein